jgi:GT2 family glycosyltransferase
MSRSKTRTPDITVVVPTRHRNEALALCLERLAPGVQSVPFEQYEVIVTDDGSSSNASKMIRERFSWASWVAGPQRGPAANRNNGARIARAPWLAFTDDDCLPEENWLENLLKNTSNINVGALEGAVLPTGQAFTSFTECPVNESGGYFWTANVAIDRDIFQAIDGFDEKYPIAAHEDQDIYIRLQERTSVKFVREAVVLHPIRDVELKAHLCMLPKRAYAYAIHLTKHRSKANSWRLLFELTLNRVRVVTKYLRQRKFMAASIAAVESLVMVPTTIHHYDLLKRKRKSHFP